MEPTEEESAGGDTVHGSCGGWRGQVRVSILQKPMEMAAHGHVQLRGVRLHALLDSVQKSPPWPPGDEALPSPPPSGGRRALWPRFRRWRRGTDLGQRSHGRSAAFSRRTKDGEGAIFLGLAHLLSGEVPYEGTEHNSFFR
jgi:hypothetical protein